jgi:TM2 domain-containing membrane protein YozV
MSTSTSLECPYCDNSRIVWMHPSQTKFNCPNCLQTFQATVPYPPPAPRRFLDCIGCGKLLKRQAKVCPECGVDQSVITPEILRLREAALQHNSTKTRHTYSTLALALGFFGAHNFYAGHLTRAIPQLLFTLLFYWTIYVPIIVWATALFEAFACKADAQGKVLV